MGKIEDLKKHIAWLRSEAAREQATYDKSIVDGQSLVLGWIWNYKELLDNTLSAIEMFEAEVAAEEAEMASDALFKADIDALFASQTDPVVIMKSRAKIEAARSKRYDDDVGPKKRAWYAATRRYHQATQKTLRAGLDKKVAMTTGAQSESASPWWILGGAVVLGGAAYAATRKRGRGRRK